MTRPESEFCRRLVSRPVAQTAARVSIVVGTALNIINQGTTIWSGGDVDWPRLLLNFAVPYAVASYSAAKAGASAP